LTCSNCGRENADDARFCSNCGSVLAPAASAREERKVVTVLFCDLVGFTGRAERMDPEEVRALLQPYHARVREELERYGGTVEKFIGDAVVALFGAPTAHEDDPERAVRAALTIREAVAGEELHVRVGVTTGEALVALDARPQSGEGMASGDVVNTGARLQAAAPVDGVLVDETTYRATARVIEYREHAAVDAKGKAEPVPVWEAVSARSRLGLDVGERTATPLVGRARELELLTGALERARQDRIVQLVTLVGEPGIGKSRLALELFRRIHDDPELIRWRQGRCLPYGEGVTLWALAEMVKAEAGVLETDSSDDAATRLGQTVAAAIADAGEAAWVERHLRPLVGLGGDVTLTGEHGDEAFAAWRRFFEGVADDGPFVAVFEDLQWADDTLLDFVDHLVDWAADVPLLVVAIARPELLTRRPSWGGGKPNAVTQSLGPLSDEETAGLVHSLLGRAVLPARVRHSLVANAGGNPLYAEEFARMLAERPNDAAEPALPESVQGIIAARLDSLEAAEKAVLQDASVLGKVFWLGALETLGGEERWRLERRLHNLERRELVRRDRQSAVGGERQYAFRHLLVREVAYGQIPRARRTEKHVATARWIEQLSPDRNEDRADMLAHHWTSALRYAEAGGRDRREIVGEARAALVEAGDRALSLNAPSAAAGFFAEALGLLGENERAPRLLLRYGRSLYLAGDASAEDALLEARDALAAAGDTEGAAFAESMLGHVSWLAGDASAARRRNERAVELVRSAAPSETTAHVLARAAASAQVGNRAEEAVAIGRQALALSEELGLVDLRVHALTTIGNARGDLGDPAGADDLEQAVELARAVNSREAGRALHNSGVDAFLAGDVGRYRDLHAEASRLYSRFGDPALARFARGATPGIAYLIGDWDEATDAADAFLAECETAPHYMENQARAFRALIRLGRDDLEGALADIERALALAGQAEDAQSKAPPLGVAARIFLELGDPRAVPTALEVLDLRIGTSPEPLSAPLLAALELPTPVDERLRSLLAERYRRESSWLAGPRAAVERRFRDAAEIYASMPFPHAEAEARLRAAEQLAGEGQRGEADAELQRALAFWRSVGATRYVARGELLWERVA